MGQISLETRKLIVFILAPILFWSPCLIQRELIRRGFAPVPTQKSIRNLIIKFRKTNTVENQKKTSTDRKINEEVMIFISQLIYGDREISLRAIQRNITEKFGIEVGRETIRKAIKEEGWKKSQTKYCQLIRNGNKIKRLAYASLCLLRQDDFEDCIFTDESSIQLSKYGTLRYRRKDEPALYGKVPKPKHPLKVHVWAGISRRGATDIVIFTGILDAAGLEEILRLSLLPFIRKEFPEGHRFIQDNDPKHTSLHIKNFMKDNNINHWRTPPESPDLNPIEMVWGDLKRFLATLKPLNQEELVQGIKKYWLTLTPSKCSRFIDHLKKTIPLTIGYNGGPTGH